MKWTFALSALSLVACSDTPRATLADLASPLPDMAVVVLPDLMPLTISVSAVAPNTVSTVGRDVLTITGTGFDSRTSFLVGGLDAEVISVNSTTAMIYAPANPGSWGIPISIQAVRQGDGARAVNSNAVASASRFSYYAATPTFQQMGRVNNSTFNTTRLALLGDFNNDGKVDIFQTYFGSANHQAYLNVGGGTFALTENIANVNNAIGPTKGFVVDLNNDTFPDILFADDNTAWSYVMGNGQGLFNSVAAPIPAQFYGAGCTSPSSPVPIKLSNANNYDVAVACNANVRIWPYVNGAAANAFYGGQNAGPSIAIPIVNPIHLAVVDVNKDTYNDLVVLNSVNSAPTLSWYNSPAAAPPQALPVVATGTAGLNNLAQNPYWLKCADLNGDGYPDCVVGDIGTNTVRVFMNNAGTFLAPIANGGTLAVGQPPREINLADMNGDGKLDLLVANNNLPSFEVIPGRGDGTFGSILSADGRTLASRTSTLVPDCQRTWSIAVADLDGDGLKDVMTTCEANNTGNPTATLGGVVLFKNTSR